MKVEKTIPINVELMTGNKKGENKMEITEKELCEYCESKSKCVSCKSCKYDKNCDNFYEALGVLPYYFLKEGKYVGKHPDRLWEEKKFEEELNKIEKREEKEKNNMLPENVKIVNKNEDNIVYVNDCSKYPIKNGEEYVCVFDGNVINNNFVNINIYGIIIDINEKNIVIYNKENKNISIVDRKSIKCLLPKEEYNLMCGRD